MIYVSWWLPHHCTPAFYLGFIYITYHKKGSDNLFAHVFVNAYDNARLFCPHWTFTFGTSLTPTSYLLFMHYGHLDIHHFVLTLPHLFLGSAALFMFLYLQDH